MSHELDLSVAVRRRHLPDFVGEGFMPWSRQRDGQCLAVSSVSASLSGRGDLFRTHRRDLCLGPRAALIELCQPPLRVRTHNVVF